MTNLQLKILHIARREIGIDEPDWRTILRSIGHVQSSKDLTNSDFEDVMAYLEGRGYRQPGKPADYWRQTIDARGTAADRRQVFLIEQLIPSSGYELAGLCHRFSDGRTDDVSHLRPREAHGLIEMLKAVGKRSEIRDQRSEIRDQKSAHLDLTSDLCPLTSGPTPDLCPLTSDPQPDLW
jgi:hypothetical protein